jgi:hypothetical protein
MKRAAALGRGRNHRPDGPPPRARRTRKAGRAASGSSASTAGLLSPNPLVQSHLGLPIIKATLRLGRASAPKGKRKLKSQTPLEEAARTVRRVG